MDVETIYSKGDIFRGKGVERWQYVPLLFYKLIRSSVSQNFKNINTAFSKLRHNKDRKFNRAITRSHKSRKADCRGVNSSTQYFF
jgi:hypothetical protein